jgi:hypothetical protein
VVVALELGCSVLGSGLSCQTCSVHVHCGVLRPPACCCLLNAWLLVWSVLGRPNLQQACTGSA